MKYGRLTVLATEKDEHTGEWHFRCLCECGKGARPRRAKVLAGTTRSCGCLKMDTLMGRLVKHGQSRSPTYNTWMGMIARCENENNPAHCRYGGRGITICTRWRTSFEFFLADMGERPKNYSLDRIDNDGNYEPDNCRWASAREQANNRRANTRIEVRGENLTTAEAIRKYKIPAQRYYARIHLGWTQEQAIELEPRKSARRRGPL